MSDLAISVVNLVCVAIMALSAVGAIAHQHWEFKKSAADSAAARREAAANERVRRTLLEFGEIRVKYANLATELESALKQEGDDGRAEFTDILIRYAQELEFFAIGVCNDGYDLDIVNEMSGNALVSQYRSTLRPLIEERWLLLHDLGKAWKGAYSNYLRMMEGIYRLRNLTWEPPTPPE